MKKFAVLGAVLTALAFSAPAQAADMPIKGPTYKAAPVAVYNWTGFYIGGHIGYGWGEDTAGIDADGFLGGIQAGYNWHLSRNWVVGIEADIAATDVSSAFGVTLDYVGTIRGRVGYAWDRMMFYGTGGYAYTRLNTGLSGDGYALGVGLEWAFAHRWTAKVEYMFHNFDFAVGDIDLSTIKLGVNYRF